MSAPKYQLFSRVLQEDAALFKALAHPARLAILDYLAETKVCMTGDITRELPLSRTTVNQHLAELKQAGLIKGEISGAKVNYCLDTEKLAEMNRDGIRLEVCLFAADVHDVDPATIPGYIHRVDNGWISTLGYQAQGYSLVAVF